MDIGAGSPAPLDGPRLELDELLRQLVARASDVLASKNRLGALLAANQGIIGELELSTVLRRIVQAACDLVDAPFGALGVVAPDGSGLEQFVHVGLDDDAVARIGALPEGKGLLGALIEDPRPIRIDDLRDDPRSVGFPEGHPPMRAFLGVPIRVRNEVFGNLYLTMLDNKCFSTEDEELVKALASTAGVAIDNARLFERAQRRQEWLQASTDVTRQLLTAGDEDNLRLIAQNVERLADADVVSLVLPNATGERLTVAVAVGRVGQQLSGSSYAMRGTVSERVMETGQPALINDARESTRQSGRLTVRLVESVPVGPVMVLPLLGPSAVRGALVVGRLAGQRVFSPDDVERATTFANHAAMALELADARRGQQRMLVLEDRARIARDLHDHVIQQLFAAGLTIQTVAGALEEPDWVRMLQAAVDSIDEGIRQIRTSIFQLRPSSPTERTLRMAVLELLAEIRPTLGTEPDVTFEGFLDSRDDQLIDDVTAVVREALTNVAKYASAGHVSLVLRAAGGSLHVTVSDDGIGVGAAPRRSGLANIRARAENRSGTCSVASDASSGTTLAWTVPLA